jgi:hypothetical protein
MAFLPGYRFRREIIITSSTSSTNYQQRIDLDATFDYSNTLANGADIRFTSEDGETLLSYWIESWVEDTSAIIWVKIPTLVIGTTTIYMYYDNPVVSDASDGESVFLFFDDFPGSSLDTQKWVNDSLGGSGWTVANSIATSSGTGLSGKLTASSGVRWEFGPGSRVRAYARSIIGTNIIIGCNDNSINASFGIIGRSGVYEVIDTVVDFFAHDTDWHIFHIVWDTDNTTKQNMDDGSFLSGSSYSDTRNAEMWQNNATLAVDWFFVADYIGEEPIVTIGNVEIVWYGSWYKRMLILIDNTNIDTNLTDFPIVVRLSTTSGKNSQDVTKVFDELESSDNRRKLVFVAGLLPLYAEIEKWDHGTEAIIHVKIPTVFAASTTELYMFYDKTKPDSGYTADVVEVIPGPNSDYFAFDTQQNVLTALSYGWSIINSDYVSYVNSDITNRGKLTIAHNTEDAVWDDDTNGFFIYKSFTGNFDVQIQFSDNASVHAEGLGLYVADNLTTEHTDWYGIRRRYYTDVYGSGIEIDVTNTVDNVSDEVYKNDSINDVFFRLTRSGTTFTAYSKAGANDSWIQRDSRTRSYMASTVNVGIGTQSGNTDGNYVAKVEYFYAEEVIAQNVWDSNFIGVYHLLQDPSGGSNSILDSSENTNHGTPSNLSAGDLVDTLLGKGYRFSGVDEWIGLGDAFYSDELTVEIVVKTDDATNKKMLIHKRNTAGAVTAGDNEWELYTQSGAAYFQGYDTQSTTIFTISTAASLNILDTFYIAGATTGITGYVDADITLNDTTSSPVNPSGAMRNVASGIQVGSRSNSDDNTYFDGDIAEIRLSNIYRTSAWRKATYYSIFDELLTFGSEEIISPDIESGITDYASLYEAIYTQLSPSTPNFTESISITEELNVFEISAVITILTPLAVSFVNSVVVGEIGTENAIVTIQNIGNTSATVKPHFRNSYFMATPSSITIDPGEAKNFYVYARPYIIGTNEDTMYFVSSGSVVDDTVTIVCEGTSAIDVVNPIFPTDNSVDILHNTYVRFRTIDTNGLYRDHLHVTINNAIVIYQGQFTDGWTGTIESYGSNNWDVTIDGPDSFGLNKTVEVEVYVLNYLGQKGLTSYHFTTRMVGEQEWDTTSQFLSNIRQNPTPSYYMESIEDGSLEVKPLLHNEVIAIVKRPFHAAYFNGSTSYISFGSWHPGTTWTLEVWFSTSSFPTTAGQILGVYSSSVTSWSIFIDSAGYISFRTRSAIAGHVTINTDVVAYPGVPYHCAVTYDGYEINIFVNGIRKVTSHNVAVNYSSWDNTPRIGGSSSYSGYDFCGYVWDARVWTVTRTSDEIAENYTKRLFGNEIGLRNLWRLEGNAIDEVGNNNGSVNDITYVTESGELESDIITYTESVDFSNLTWELGGIGGLQSKVTAQISVKDSIDTPEPDDDFSGGVIDTTKWEIFAGTPYISSGVLRCDVESGSSNDEGVRSTYYLIGDFDIQIDYDLVSGPSTSSWYADLRVSHNNGNIVAVGRRYIGTHQYEIIGYNGVTSTWDTATTVTNTDTSGKLRMVRDGSLITGYYWNGSVWASIGIRTVVGDGDVRVELFVYNAVGNPAASISFDNFILNSGTVALKWSYVGPDNTDSTYFDSDNHALTSFSGKYFRYKLYIMAGIFNYLTYVNVSVFSYWQARYNMYHQKVLRQVQVDRLSVHPNMDYRLSIRTASRFSALSSATWSDWVSGFEMFSNYILFNLESLYLLCNAYEIKVEATVNSTLQLTDSLEAETYQLDNLREQETSWITGTYPTYSLALTEDWEITMAWSKDREVTLTNANNYVIDDLDGNTEKMYMILLYGYLTANSTNHVIGLLPNGDTISSNYGRGIQMVADRASGTTFNSTAGWTGGTEAILPLGHNKWSAHGRFMARGIINAESSAYRMIRSEWTFTRNGYDDYLLTGHASNMWEDASTNITFLTLHFDGATDFDGKLILFSLRG